MRSFFLIVRTQIQAFTRRPVWMLLLAFGVLFALGCYYYVYPTASYRAVGQTAYAQVVLTLVFMMFGIEMRREQRRERLDDIFAAYAKQARLIPWAQITAVGLLSLLTTLVVMAGCYIQMAADDAPALWIQLSLSYVALLYFFPCFILGVWGLLISHWNAGKSVYLPAILVWLPTSTLWLYFADFTRVMGLGGGGFLINAFNMGINDFHMFDNLSTGAPVELPRWTARIGILALLAALYVCFSGKGFASTRIKKRNAWIKIGTVFTCGALMIALFYARYGFFFTWCANPSYAKSFAYKKHDEYIPGMPVSLADFPTQKNITPVKTDIDLSCTTQGINAKVEMKAILSDDASGQSFVLYSDLKVDEILLDGAAAEFDRSHDGIMVYFPEEKKSGETVNFTFKYHGYSLPSFPANETTVQLNRSFPWIPWPGIKTVSNYSNNLFEEAETFFIQDWQRGDEVAYSLKYKGPGHLYTNLAKQGDNTYYGISDDGVSLYSGMLHSAHRGVDVYVPASLYDLNGLPADAVLDAYDRLLDLCERMDAVKKPEKPRTIAVIQMRCSVIVGPQELYSWGDEWEIRMRNESSTTTASRNRADSLEAYQSSIDVNENMAIPYLLNSCTGFPIELPKVSISSFAGWLRVYIRANGGGDIEYDAETLRTRFYSGGDMEIINGERIPQPPLTEDEERWMDEIVSRMQAGENFDEPFKALYQRLLSGEVVLPMDILSELYHYQGEE